MFAVSRGRSGVLGRVWMALFIVLLVACLVPGLAAAAAPRPAAAPDLGRIVAILEAFLQDSRLDVIVAMIVLDLALGVAVALKLRIYEWRALSDFYLSNVVPGVIGYGALYVVLGYQAGLESILGQGLVTAAFAPLCASLAASVGSHLKILFGISPPVEGAASGGASGEMASQ